MKNKGWYVLLGQVDAVCLFLGPHWAFTLICPSFSLGCSAAAPGSPGGCCAAAKTGTTEVQHGQRSAGGRKCETNDDFHVAVNFLTCSSSIVASSCESKNSCITLIWYLFAGRAQTQAEWTGQIDHWIWGVDLYCLPFSTFVAYKHVLRIASSCFFFSSNWVGRTG